MKTWFKVVAITILAAAPARAASDACRVLLEQARELRVGTLSCEASADELSVSAGSPELGQKARALLFPQDLFLGRKVRLIGAAAHRSASGTTGVSALKLPSFLSEVSADVDFDGAADRQDGVFTPMDFDVALDTGTPPGSGGSTPPGSGGSTPPGSGGSTPPGSGGSTPPGSGGNTPPGSGGSTPPGSGGGQQDPPSKPIPVAPAPPPAWWNTAQVQNLSGPMTNYGSDYYDASGEGYTRWYPWPKYFYDTTRTTGKSVINRTAANAGTTYNSTLSSQEKTQTRQCYYRAYYIWNSYEGQWDFDHYKAACAVIRVDHAAPDMMGVTVEFDMAGMTFLPWEKESIGVTFDGSKVGVDLSGAAFNYAVSGPIVDQGNGTATVKLTAVSRIKRAPEKDMVSVNLKNVGGSLKLDVVDNRASYYAGEVLQVKVKIKKDVNWAIDPTIIDQTLSITVKAQTSQTTTFNVPTSKGAGEYYIDSWSFRRDSSKISTNDWIYKGSGNKAKL